MTFLEAKKKADKTGGLVCWWVSYYVVEAKDWNESCGYAKYVSKKAEKFLKEKYLESKL